MARVHGLSHREVDELIAQVEQAAARSLELAIKKVSASLGLVLTAAGSDQPAQPPAFVNLDDLGAIQTVWSTEVDAVLGPLVGVAFGRGADAVGVAIGDSFKGFEVPAVSSAMTEDHLAAATNRMKNTASVVWEQTRNQLVDGMRAGEGVDKLSARLETARGMAESDATRVARTEVISAANAGSFTMAQTTGLEMEKVWMATEDMRTRPAHRLADGQKQPLTSPFNIDTFPMQYPGDPAGPAGQVINCRCTLGYDIPEDQPALTTASEAIIEPTVVTSNFVETTVANFAETAPAVESRSASYYVGDGYKTINQGLRRSEATVEDLPHDVRAHVEQLDAALSTGLRHDAVLHRGVSYWQKMFENGRGTESFSPFETYADRSLVGMEWTDPTFVSTTGDPEVITKSKEFASRHTGGGAVLRVLAPAGTPAGRLSTWRQEAEVLLGRGLRYRVVADHGIVDGLRHLDVEVVR